MPEMDGDVFPSRAGGLREGGRRRQRSLRNTAPHHPRGVRGERGPPPRPITASARSGAWARTVPARAMRSALTLVACARVATRRPGLLYHRPGDWGQRLGQDEDLAFGLLAAAPHTPLIPSARQRIDRDRLPKASGARGAPFTGAHQVGEAGHPLASSPSRSGTRTLALTTAGSARSSSPPYHPGLDRLFEHRLVRRSTAWGPQR